MSLKHRRGFTLIELLVVVLIIAILAAVAVPKYQKAVARSRATQLQMLLASAVEAADLYYLQNGRYPTSLDQLDIRIDLPTEARLTTGVRSACAKDLVDESVKKGENFEIVLYDGGTAQKYRMGAWFTTGRYKCAGFVHWFNEDIPGMSKKTFCAENYYDKACGNGCDKGVFCHDVMGLNQFDYHSTVYSYK